MRRLIAILWTLRRVLFVVGVGVAIALWVLAMALTFSDRVAP